MLACVDVDYRDPVAVAACVLFTDWVSLAPSEELTQVVQNVAPYESGSFYKRELPCLLAVLGRVQRPLEAVVVDSYVDLSPGTAGLGRRLFEHIGLPVIGVAKTEFAGAVHAVPVLRGISQRPLYVTAAGIDPRQAAARILAMAGPHRLPTMLKRVDRLCRDTQST